MRKKEMHGNDVDSTKVVSLRKGIFIVIIMVHITFSK